MSSRETILAAIRANKPAPRPLPDVPMFDAGRGDDILGRFSEALKLMGGRIIEGDALAAIRTRVAAAGRVISMVPEIAGNSQLDPDAPPTSLDDVDIAVVRARFGVAETGSVLFTDADLGINTLVYLAQHLVVLLDPAHILINLHHAYGRPDFAQAAYCVLHTGPSATADIEGVLIHGAQGVRSLSVAFVPAS